MLFDKNVAISEFNDYLKKFDINDPKIKLKVVHTFQVMKLSEQIARSLKLSTEEIEIAWLIGLLHDIGRFEQLKRFNSFDDRNISHAKLSLSVLFNDGYISRFIKSRDHDEIIYSAIKFHSDFKLPESLESNNNLLMQCKIIRDSDKLDNFRVKKEEPIETYLNISLEDLGKESISDKVYNDVLANKCVLRSDRKTLLDVWISFLAFIFDLNFKFSFEYILQNHCIEDSVDLIKYIDPVTKDKMTKIKESCLNFCKKKII